MESVCVLRRGLRSLIESMPYNTRGIQTLYGICVRSETGFQKLDFDFEE